MVRSVLIVDDEPNIVRSLQFLMTKAGYDVRVAAWVGEVMVLAAMVCQGNPSTTKSPTTKDTKYHEGRPRKRLRSYELFFVAVRISSTNPATMPRSNPTI